MKTSRFLIIGALLGLLGVAMGAFGAHGLAGRVSPHHLATWKTAAHYHQLHAVLLVVLSLLDRRSRALSAACVLVTAGIAIFSGSLYAIVLGGPGKLGAITPLGGLSLMAGWLAIAVHGWRYVSETNPE